VPTVELPDGREVEFPDGMTNEQIEAAIKANAESLGIKPAVKDTRSAPNKIKDAILQGYTFGFADEIRAAGRTPVRMLRTGESLTDAYKGALADEQGQLAAFNKEHPIASTTLEILGGVPALPFKVAQAATLPGRVAQSAAIGAGYGALSGAGHAEGGVGDRAVGAGTGAAVGGVAGAALPLVTSGVGKVSGKVADFVGLRDPEKAANRHILRALGRDKLSPDDVQSAIAARQAEAAKPEALFDVGGENLRGVARTAAGTPGEAKHKAVEFVLDRQAGQSGRVSDDVAKLINPNADFYGAVDDLIAKRSKEARPLYEKAYQIGDVWSDDLGKILNTPAGKSALNNAKTIAANEGVDLPEPVAGKVPMQVWDYIKRGMDDVVQGARNPVTGKIETDTGRAVNSVRTQLLDELDNLNPAYKAARASYAGNSASLDAVQAGRSIFKEDAELTAKTIAKLSPGDKEFFRAGAVRAIKDIADGTPDGTNIVRRFFGKPAFRDRLAAAFENKSDFMKFESLMNREIKMFENAARVSPRTGSQTQLRGEEAADMAIDPTIFGSLLRGDLVGAGGQLAKEALRRSQGINSSTADVLANKLFTSDPATQAKVLEALRAQMAADAGKAGLLGRYGQAGAGLLGEMSGWVDN
jgi:hypothetical protein